MRSDRTAARMIGGLFILAAVTAVAGLLLYDPILNGSDYMTRGAEQANRVLLGVLMELLLVVSAIGTATTLFPILRRYNETVALWHVCFRFLEAIVIAVGVISILALLALSQQFVAAAAPDAAVYGVSGSLLHAVYKWTFMLGPNFLLGLNTVMYSYIFYRTRIVPRFIPMVGLAGGTLVFICAILVLFGVIDQLSTWGALLALPVAANEMILAVWLIAKGFNPSAMATLRAGRTA